MTRLRCVLALLVFGVTSCSPPFYMTVQNNSATEVEICNLHRHENACVSAAPHGHARVPLVADYAASSWAFRISSSAGSKTYDFGHVDLSKVGSVDTCSMFNRRSCELVVQLEPDGFLYWVDASRNTAGPAPVQPDGFPIRPGA
jgi:hypothetical protein